MKIEYEATFVEIEKEESREKLKKAGAELLRPEFLQKRDVFDMPPGKEIPGGFLRVRNEGDKITLTLKIIDGQKISDQRETEITVSDFEATSSILRDIGCVQMSYEESKRELWNLDDVAVTIDTWPHLGSIVEVEGKSEAEVKTVSEKLGFNWKDAKFCSIGTLYKEKFGLGPINLFKKTGQMTQLTFDKKNPFIN